MQDSAEPGHREERQLPSCVYVMDSSFLHVRDAGTGEAVQGDDDGHGDSEGHSLQYPGGDHAEW